MNLAELTAREEIRDLVAAYAHLADSGRFDALCLLFAEDAVLEPGEQPPARGRDEIRRFLSGTRDSLAEGRTDPAGAPPSAGTRTAPAARSAWIRHHVSNLRIRLLDADHAEGEAYFLVVTDRGPDHWGRYRDRYVRGPQGWLFGHRRARLDGFGPGSWVAARRGTLAP